jgi:pSer/pThr/pTyr-binding forkhead associated (FHA) protein
MPAQQRLDKAQSQIDAANAQREHGREQQQASAAQLASNAQRRDQLLSQTQDDVLAGRLTQANDHLNDAERLGAAGPEIERLRSVIASRLRNRLLLRLGLGGIGIAALAWAVFYWFRRGRSIPAAFLVALDGADKGKRYILNQEVTHIGGIAMDGGKKNEVLVNDPDRQVSRFHCEVHKRGNSCYLVDLASSNGTYLRRRPLQPGVAVRLRDGDKFTLARSVAFELRIERQKAS